MIHKNKPGLEQIKKNDTYRLSTYDYNFWNIFGSRQARYNTIHKYLDIKLQLSKFISPVRGVKYVHYW
jgi:hypothetical protein